MDKFQQSIVTNTVDAILRIIREEGEFSSQLAPRIEQTIEGTVTDTILSTQREKPKTIFS
jgi:hypothetical protein